MLRKTLVSDLLRSLAYCVRTGDREMLFPILGFRMATIQPGRKVEMKNLAHFCSWAFSVQTDERVVCRNLSMLKHWFRELTAEEQVYLTYLLQTYYPIEGAYVRT